MSRYLQSRSMILFAVCLFILTYSASGNAFVKIDSYGNPIVNETAGLPDWSQKNIDGLETSIEHYLNLTEVLRDVERSYGTKYNPNHPGYPYSIRSLEDVRGSLAESEYALGNFIGQAITRKLNIEHLVDLRDPSVATGGVADSVLEYIHFYENVSFVRVGKAYSPTQYSPEITSIIESYGGNMGELLSIDSKSGNRAVPSAEYIRETYTRGMTFLSGGTTIWTVDGLNDAQRDIGIGFTFYFYDQTDPDPNTIVRVSTNGYMSFYQQGGGAEDGVDPSNDIITALGDPDGYIAGWWDDLIVNISQGMPDTVHYATQGSVGSRVFTVEYYSMSRRFGDATDTHDFQMKIYESTNVIELHYGGVWIADSIDDATVGMEDYEGNDGDFGPNSGDLNNVRPPDNYRFLPSSEDCPGEYITISGLAPGFGGTLTIMDDTSAARDDIDEPVEITCWTGLGAAERVYRFFPAIDKQFQIDLLGSSYDNTMAIVNPCPDGSVVCYYSEDYIGLDAGFDCMNFTAGTLYYIIVSGNGATGSYQLNVTECGPTATPTNTPTPTPSPTSVNIELCPGALIDISSWLPADGNIYTNNHTTGGVADNIDEPTEISCWVGNAAPELVHFFIPPQDMYLQIDLDGSSYDTKMAIVNPCPDGLVSCQFSDNYIDFNAGFDYMLYQAGVQYSIIISGNAAVGPYQINIRNRAFETCPGVEIDLSTWLPGAGDTLTLAGSTVGSSDDIDELIEVGCWEASDAAEHVYFFTPPHTLSLQIDSVGSALDTKMAIVADCPGGDFFCLYNDDYAGTDAGFNCTVFEAGISYTIIVSGYDGEIGDFVLNIDECESSAETCSGIDLNLAQWDDFNHGRISLQGSTTGASDDIDEPTVYPCWDSTGSAEHVYHFYGLVDLPLQIDLEGSSFDTRMAIVSSCADGSLFCEYNDDYIGSASGFDCIVFDAYTNYYIIISGPAGQTGDYVLNIDYCTESCPGLDIDMATLFPGSGQTVTFIGDTTHAFDDIDEATEVVCWLDTTAPEHVYRLSPSLTTLLQIDLMGSSFDTKMAIVQGCPDGGVSCLYNDDFHNLNAGFSCRTFSAGEDYYIIVSGAYGEVGPYMLNLRECQADTPVPTSTPTPTPPPPPTSTPTLPPGDNLWVGGGYYGCMGEVITVEIMIENPNMEIDHFAFDVTVNPAMLWYQDCEVGSIDPDWMFLTCAETSAGVVHVEGSLPASPIPQGTTGSIIRLNYQVTCESCFIGQSDSIGIINPAVDVETFNIRNGDYTYYCIPIPATSPVGIMALLTIIGLIMGIGSLRRRK